VGRHLRGVGGEAVHHFGEPFIEGSHGFEDVCNLCIQIIMEIGRHSLKLVGQVCSDCSDFLTDHFGKVVLNVCQDLGLEVFGTDQGDGRCCDGCGGIVCGAGVLGCIFILVSGGFGKFGVFGCIKVEGIALCRVMERGPIPLFLDFVTFSVVNGVLVVEFVSISI